jgi:hypothetical protein
MGMCCDVAAGQQGEDSQAVVVVLDSDVSQGICLSKGISKVVAFLYHTI